MNKTLKLGIILLVISVVSAGILSFANAKTKDKIEAIELEITKKALSDIFEDMDESVAMDEAEFKAIEEKYPEIVEVFEITEAGESIGHSITLNTNGFKGPIELMVGFSKEGELQGVRLLNHGETAGIGDKAAEPEFTNEFVGLDAADEVEVETISGATITSTAVIKGVNEARTVFNEFIIE